MTEITNDDRRRVAEKVRHIEAERLDSTYGGDAICILLTLGYIADAVGLRYAPYELSSVELRDRLADLIEPSRDASATHTDASATRGVSQMSRSDVDRDALLALADEIDERFRALQGLLETGSDFKNFMGVSGALGDEFERHEIAERIREACGVTADA